MMDEKRVRRRLSGKGNLPLKKLVMLLLYSFQGFATTFILNQLIENDEVLLREAISTLCHLAGWSEEGGTWALYIRDVMERHLDSSAYIYR